MGLRGRSGTCRAVLATAAIALSSGCAFAADQEGPPPAPRYVPVQSGGMFGIGPTIGTLGLGGEISVRVLPWVVIRANGSGYSYSRTQGLSSNSFAIDTSLLSFGLIADLHPFSSGFRISGGVRYHDMHLAGSITPDVATVTINGVSYPIAVIGTLHADVTGNKIAPYLGLGFDSSHFYPSNFSLSFDVGAVYFGNPKVVLSTDGTAPGLEANLRAEEEKVQDALKFLQFYPVAMLTAKFVF